VLALSALNVLFVRAASIVLVLYALRLGAHPVTVGLIGTMFSVLPLVLSVPAGRLSDRFGAFWLLVIGFIGGAIGMLVPALISGIGAIFVAATLIGLPYSLHVTLQNLVGLSSTPQTQARDFSNFSLAISISTFIGPMASGFAFDHAGPSTACAIIALIALVPFATTIIRGRNMPASPPPATKRSGGVLAMLGEPAVRKVLVTTSLINIGNDLYLFYLPVYATSVGVSASAIGIVLGMSSVAAFVMRMLIPRLVARYNVETLLAYAFFMGAVSLCLIPFLSSAIALGLISFLFGLGMGFGQPVITMLMFRGSPKGRSGEALGLRMTVVHITKLVGPVAFGSIGSALGLPPMFWINAVLLATGGLLSRPKSS
jgi:MFS family permease